MPNERTFGVPPAAPTKPAAADPLSDSAAAIAAIGRMEAAIRGNRAAFVRLRNELAAMASTVADAKTALQAGAIKPDDASGGKALAIGPLLADFDRRLAAMMFLADFMCDGGPDAADREIDHVPTVSDVVARLGRDGETAPADNPGAASARPERADVPSVTMLGALVEALAAAVAPTAPAADAEPAAAEAPPPAATDRDAAEPAAPAAPHEAQPGPAEAPKPALSAAPAVDLLDHFARMEPTPLSVSGPGQAVIPERDHESPPVGAPAALGGPTPPAAADAPAASDSAPAAPADGAARDPAASPPSEPRSAAATPRDPLDALNALTAEERRVWFG